MWRGRNRKVEEIEPQVYEEPMGKRIGRFVTLIGFVFAVSGGVVVTQRLSEDALALLLGLSCGVAAMVPTVVLGGLWIKRELGQRTPSNPPLSQGMGQPQVIVVTPQALPGNGLYNGYNYGQSPQGALSAPIPAQWQSVPAQREFKIVGGVD